MDQRPALEGEQRFRLLGDRVLGQPGALILFDGVVHRLLEFRFQLQGGNRQAVDEQHQIDPPGLGLLAGLGQMLLGDIGAVDQLRYDP